MLRKLITVVKVKFLFRQYVGYRHLLVFISYVQLHHLAVASVFNQLWINF